MNHIVSISTALAFCWWGQLPPHGEFERDWLAFMLLSLVTLVLGLRAHRVLSTGGPSQSVLAFGKPLWIFQWLWLALTLVLVLQYLAMPPEVWGGRSLLTLGWLLGAFCATWLGVLSAAPDKASAPEAAWRAVARGLVAAAVFNALVAWVQVLPWSALQALAPAPAQAGRGYGALLQPNLTATLLVIGLASLDGLLRTTSGVRPSPVQLLMARMVAVVLGSGVAVTGSRVGLLLLLLWCLSLIWRSRHPGHGKQSQSAAGLSFLWPLLGSSLTLLAGALNGVDVATAVDRWAALSNGRALIFSHALDMGLAFPWWGAGFGQLSYWHVELPYHPKMPGYLTHAHNLVLQFWAELGALGVVWLTVAFATLAWPLGSWRRRSDGALSEDRRWALTLLLMVMLHSMTEMPLWSAPFLLLFGFAAGLWLAPQAGTRAESAFPWNAVVKYGTVIALVGIALCVWVYRDYLKVSALYDGARWAPSAPADVAQRANTSVFFHPAAEFAAANSAQVNAQSAEAYSKTLPVLWRYVTDPRMFEWQLRTSAWSKDARAFSHHAQRFQWVYPGEYEAFKATVTAEQTQLPWNEFSPDWP